MSVNYSHVKKAATDPALKEENNPTQNESTPAKQEAVSSPPPSHDYRDPSTTTASTDSTNRTDRNYKTVPFTSSAGTTPQNNDTISPPSQDNSSSYRNSPPDNENTNKKNNENNPTQNSYNMTVSYMDTPAKQDTVSSPPPPASHDAHSYRDTSNRNNNNNSDHNNNTNDNANNNNYKKKPTISGSLSTSTSTTTETPPSNTTTTPPSTTSTTPPKATLSYDEFKQQCYRYNQWRTTENISLDSGLVEGTTEELNQLIVRAQRELDDLKPRLEQARKEEEETIAEVNKLRDQHHQDTKKEQTDVGIKTLENSLKANQNLLNTYNTALTTERKKSEGQQRKDKIEEWEGKKRDVSTKIADFEQQLNKKKRTGVVVDRDQLEQKAKDLEMQRAQALLRTTHLERRQEDLRNEQNNMNHHRSTLVVLANHLTFVSGVSNLKEELTRVQANLANHKPLLEGVKLSALKLSTKHEEILAKQGIQGEVVLELQQSLDNILAEIKSSGGPGRESGSGGRRGSIGGLSGEDIKLFKKQFAKVQKKLEAHLDKLAEKQEKDVQQMTQVVIEKVDETKNELLIRQDETKVIVDDSKRELLQSNADMRRDFALTQRMTRAMAMHYMEALSVLKTKYSDQQINARANMAANIVLKGSSQDIDKQEKEIKDIVAALEYLARQTPLPSNSNEDGDNNNNNNNSHPKYALDLLFDYLKQNDPVMDELKIGHVEWIEEKRMGRKRKIVLGDGNFGKIYKAKWGDHEVATKAIKEREGSSYNDFINEAKTMWVLRHPNVLSIYGLYTEESKLYLVMEYMEMGSLKRFLQEELTDDKKLDISLFVDMARQIISGMEFLHGKKVLHRDLAARNILLTKSFRREKANGPSSPYLLKIGDFGLSRKIKKNIYQGPTQTEFAICWTAPECQQDEKQWTAASDIWSFGVVLWEIVSFGRDPSSSISGDLETHFLKHSSLPKPDECPEELWQIINSCWKFKPDERIKWEDLKSALDSLRDNNNNLAPLIPPASSQTQYSHRRENSKDLKKKEKEKEKDKKRDKDKDSLPQKKTAGLFGMRGSGKEDN